jgi:hypothetical protein
MSVTNEVLTKVRQQSAANEAAKREAYIELARDCLDDKAGPPEDVLARLEACGGDAEQLHDDVELVARVRADTAYNAERKAEFDRRWPAWKQKWDAAVATMAAATKAYEAETRTAQMEENECKAIRDETNRMDRKAVEDRKQIAERGLSSLLA